MSLFERLGIESSTGATAGRTVETRAHETIDNDAWTVQLAVGRRSEASSSALGRTMLTKADTESVDQGVHVQYQRSAGLPW